MIDTWRKGSVNETWEAMEKKTREMQIRDIMKSVELDREKMRKDPGLEPFSFEDLVRSAKKSIWVSEIDLRLMCAEALWRLLPKEDYRANDLQIYLEDLKLGLSA
jgi:hypothetical protein